MTGFHPFLHGVLCCGFAVLAAVFARYACEQRDRLFVYFSIAFAIMAVHNAVLAKYGVGSDLGTVFYALRMLALLPIVIAIIDKNLRQASAQRPADPLSRDAPP